MSNSKNGTEPQVSFVKREPKLTPPGYDIKLTVAQGLAIAEMLESTGWKVLKNFILPQRKDHIARSALNLANRVEELGYFKGEVAELQLLAKTLPRLAQAAKKADEGEDNDTSEE